MSGERLMLFAPSAYPLGGVATWASYLLPGLRARGWRPTLALTQGRFHDPAAYLARHPFAPAAFVSCGAGAQASRVRHAARAIAAEDPDLVVVVNLPDVILAAARLRRRGAFAGRVVAVEHGLSRETLLDMRALAEVLDAFVGANRLICELAPRFAGLTSARVFYAPYGASAPQTSPRGEPRPEKVTLLYAGRLEDEQKRVHDLPRLAAELAELGVSFRMWIAGGGPAEDALRRRFADAPHEIAFLGVVEPEAFRELVLPQADALIVVSSWETGPLVAWEAMAAGVPVVSSRYAGSGAERALVDGENCLMFPIGDMRAAAAAIRRLSSPDLAANLRRGGSELVGARYSRAVSVARWDQVFREILTLPPLPRLSTPETLRPAGRLDRWLGARAGDLLRAKLGLSHKHAEPGGEWPHLLRRRDAEAESFETLVSACEAGIL